MRTNMLSLLLVGLLLAAPLHAEVAAPVAQSSSGDKSPVVNAGGDVEINYGLKQEEYRQMLREELARANKEMQAPGLAAEERRLLELKAKALENKLADVQKSYEDELARRKAADSALAELKGQLPDARLDEAGRKLREGDTKTAEQVFDEVVDKEGKPVAIAACQSGKLAEGRMDYVKSMRQYKKAATLDENNPAYLQAAGQMALTLGDYSQAQEWLSRLVAIEQGKKIEDRCRSCALNDLAMLYSVMGRYAEAESLLKNDLAIKEQFFGKNHKKIATVLENLATLYQDQGRYAEAEPLHKRSLEISEKILGRDHPSVATVLNNLAALNQNQGRYEEAKLLYKRTLEIWEKTLGKEHQHVAAVLGNLANSYDLQGRYEEAESLYKRSLELKEKILGKNHPDVAVTLTNLAGLYDLLGRYSESEPLHKRALTIFENKLGKEHPNVASILNNLALLYMKQRQYWEADVLYRRSLDITENSLGKDHPVVADILYNLAELRKAQGLYAEAESLHQQALINSEKVLGKDHPNVANSLNGLAELYRTEGRYAEAEPLYQRALAIFKAKLPAGHPNIKTVQKNYDTLKEKMAGL